VVSDLYCRRWKTDVGQASSLARASEDACPTPAEIEPLQYIVSRWLGRNDNSGVVYSGLLIHFSLAFS
jgi:hypothetical protein